MLSFNKFRLCRAYWQLVLSEMKIKVCERVSRYCQHLRSTGHFRKEEVFAFGKLLCVTGYKWENKPGFVIRAGEMVSKG